MLKICIQKAKSVAVIKVTGRIAIGYTSRLSDVVLLQNDVDTVVLDLARVTAVDAHGLGVLLELRHKTQEKGVQFRLANVTRFVRWVLEITCLDTVFEISSESYVFSESVDN